MKNPTITRSLVTVTAGVVTGTMLVAGIAAAQSMLFTTSMSIGSSGAEVSALQTFLAQETTHYPEGLITGYYGPLTAAAVQRFQCAQGIVCSGTTETTGYGRVGPKTLAQLNLVAGSSVGADDSAPIIRGVSVATTSGSATIHFSTNESSVGKVYYASFPLSLSEAVDKGSSAFVSGTSVSSDANLKVIHSISIGGLSGSTTYFYAVQATDSSGNTSFTWPSTFRTAP